MHSRIFRVLTCGWIAARIFRRVLAGRSGCGRHGQRSVSHDHLEDHLRGRLAGIEMVSYMSGPMLGNAEAGIVASLFSIRTSVVSGGVLCELGRRYWGWPIRHSGIMTDAKDCFANREKKRSGKAFCNSHDLIRSFVFQQILAPVNRQGELRSPPRPLIPGCCSIKIYAGRKD
jgi:hypothetical protein